MRLFTVRRAPVAPTRGLMSLDLLGLRAAPRLISALSLGCVLGLTLTLAGCALDTAPEGEESTSQDSAELSFEEADETATVTPPEQEAQDLPGGEIGDDSSDPTPDPWHSTDPTPDPWDEVDDGIGHFIAPHQER